MNKILFSVLSVALLLIVCFLCGVLPESPFLAYIDYSELNDYLGFINFVLPIDQIIAVSEAWLLCLGPSLLSQYAIKGLLVLGEYIPFT